MTSPLLVATCATCQGARTVPDPSEPGRWMACPECADHDDHDPAPAAALPDAPVKELRIYAVAGEEDGSPVRARVLEVDLPPGCLPLALTFAGLHADDPEVQTHFAGGEVRVCDAVGHVWHRVPVAA